MSIALSGYQGSYSAYAFSETRNVLLRCVTLQKIYHRFMEGNCKQPCLSSNEIVI